MAALRSEGLALAQRMGLKGDAVAAYADGYLHGVKHALAHPESCREEAPAAGAVDRPQAGLNADAIWAMRRKLANKASGGDDAVESASNGGVTSPQQIFASRARGRS